MANSHIPGSDVQEVRPDRPKARAAEAAQSSAGGGNGSAAGPRKLVRPMLPARGFKERSSNLRNESPLLAHHAAMAAAPAEESSHAEAFYFQKQIQTQTLMAFVLEDGEQIEGYIEWYDRNVIKVRNGSRTLIYKSSIKYLYKVGEAYGQ